MIVWITSMLKSVIARLPSFFLKEVSSMSQHSLFLKAQSYIPGGVNSPVRAFRAVGGEPVDYFCDCKRSMAKDLVNLLRSFVARVVSEY
jgi:hypothetical protein